MRGGYHQDARPFQHEVDRWSELGGTSKQVATESMAYILVGRVTTWRGTGLNKSDCPELHLKKTFDSGMSKYLIHWLGK